jgi:ketosteroid isomerase-like protein
MLHANLEIAKRAIDAFNRRDVDDFAELTTPDFEFFPAMDTLVEGSSHRGRGGIETYFNDIRDTWEELRLLPDEFCDLSATLLLWLGRVEALGRGSDVRVDAPTGAVFDLRDGKLSRIRAYLDHGEALRAAGLAG